MKKAISEFLPLTNRQKNSLWDNSIFVFDTNVLLNAYRCSKKASEDFTNALKTLNGRIWLPRQVAKEFGRNLPATLHNRMAEFESINKSSQDLIQKMRDLISNSNCDAKTVDDAEKCLNKSIAKIKEECLISENISYEIVQPLLKLFDGKVGRGFDEQTIIELKKIGSERFENKIPPGYKDKEKSNGNQSGDFIIWKEIMEYSKESKQNIIFVTNDKKEDWWWIVNGKTIGARYELRQEFKKETGNEFHMYTLESFLNVIKQRDKAALSDNTILELIEADNTNRVILNTKHLYGNKEYLLLRRKIKALRSELNSMDWQIEKMEREIERQGDNVELELIQKLSMFKAHRRDVLDRLEIAHKEKMYFLKAFTEDTKEIDIDKHGDYVDFYKRLFEKQI